MSPATPLRDEEPLVIARRDEHVVTLSLNRPENRNVLSIEMLHALVDELERAADDPEAAVIVLRGNGDGFSAGADLGSLVADNGIVADRERMRRTYGCLDAIYECPLPTVASVHGFALGGGADLAIHCDFLIIADDARFGHPAVRGVGVPPTNMWLYRLGPQLARRLLYTGDRITGTEAARIGMALYSCPVDELDDASQTFAARVALAGRECLIGNKQVVNRGVDLMGRGVLNAIARTEDAIGHRSSTSTAFLANARTLGVGEAARRRDAPYLPEPDHVSGAWRPDPD